MRLQKQINDFKNFYEHYDFKLLEITEKNGVYYCEDLPLIDDEGKTVGETEKFINVGYKLKGPFSKVLSNIFPYEFTFKGKKIASIESVFQGIKFPSKKQQNLILKYKGLDANNVKVTTTYNWQETGYIYWQGEPIKRDSKEYEDFIIELYVSAMQNPLYKGALRNTHKYILHSIGEIDKTKTVFTRYEFEKMLNALKDYVQKEEK